MVLKLVFAGLLIRLNTPFLGKEDSDMNKSNEPFEIIGKLKPKFVNDEWTYTEEIFADSYLHSYPDEECDYLCYIENPDKSRSVLFGNNYIDLTKWAVLLVQITDI